jgi:putative intracellular protease/amidase
MPIFTRCCVRRSMIRLVALAVCGAAACSFAWHYRRHEAPLNDRQRSFVRELAVRGFRSEASRPIRIAIFHAQIPASDPTEGLADVFDSDAMCSWKSVGPIEIISGALKDYDVVVFPGGSARHQSKLLGDEGRRAVRDFVRSGGGYVGVCAGAFLAATGDDLRLALVNVKTVNLKPTMMAHGPVNVELTGAGLDVFATVPRTIDLEYSGGPILWPAGVGDLPECVALAIYRTEIYEHESQAGLMLDTPAIVAGQFGEGCLILFSPHPEASTGFESLVVQAIRAVANHSDQ